MTITVCIDLKMIPSDGRSVITDFPSVILSLSKDLFPMSIHQQNKSTLAPRSQVALGSEEIVGLRNNEYGAFLEDMDIAFNPSIDFL